MKKAISWVNGSQWWSCHLLYVFSPKAASVRPTAKKKVFQGSAPVYRQGYVLQMRTPHPPTWSANSPVVNTNPPPHPPIPFCSVHHVHVTISFLCQSGNSTRCFHLGICCDNYSIMKYTIVVNCCSQITRLCSCSDWCCSKGLLHVMTHAFIIATLICPFATACYYKCLQHYCMWNYEKILPLVH